MGCLFLCNRCRRVKQIPPFGRNDEADGEK